MRGELAEGRAIDPDRMGEVSRWHSSPAGRRDEGLNGIREELNDRRADRDTNEH
ncbi:MAG: hypothetical protein ABIF87_14225 [Pseudomonadota bacterium]